MAARGPPNLSVRSRLCGTRSGTPATRTAPVSGSRRLPVQARHSRLFIKETEALNETVEHISESLLLLPRGKVEDIIFRDLVAQTPRPPTPLPAIVQCHRAQHGTFSLPFQLARHAGLVLNPLASETVDRATGQSASASCPRARRSRRKFDAVRHPVHRARYRKSRTDPRRIGRREHEIDDLSSGTSKISHTRNEIATSMPSGWTTRTRDRQTLVRHVVDGTLERATNPP